MATVDFAKPETLHKLAALPFYGQAEAVVRRIDPPAVWTVQLERWTSDHDKPCPHCGGYDGDWTDRQTKKVEVVASSEDEAERLAMVDNKGWVFERAIVPTAATAVVPSGLLS